MEKKIEKKNVKIVTEEVIVIEKMDEKREIELREQEERVEKREKIV